MLCFRKNVETLLTTLNKHKVQTVDCLKFFFFPLFLIAVSVISFVNNDHIFKKTYMMPWICCFSTDEKLLLPMMASLSLFSSSAMGTKSQCTVGIPSLSLHGTMDE